VQHRANSPASWFLLVLRDLRGEISICAWLLSESQRRVAAKLTPGGGYVSFWSHLPEVFMKLSSRLAGEVVILDVEGKILLGEGDIEIKRAIDELLAQGRKKFLINLAKVPYIDSAGLGQIIRCFTAIRKAGGVLKLMSPNPRVIDLLTVTKLVNVFDWYNEESSALGSFGPKPVS
jgi:anti-sigma B factor antagonist